MYDSFTLLEITKDEEVETRLQHYQMFSHFVCNNATTFPPNLSAEKATVSGILRHIFTYFCSYISAFICL